ncbi:MAG: hypothetical protein U5K84_09260 [Alkalibacterium sp.]|nr:hypothetical protein [Alkalibacterium sp.]
MKSISSGWKIVAPVQKQKASDGAKSIQRYEAATVEREHTGEVYKIHIDNFFDRLYGLVRIREGKVESVEGGMLTPVTAEIFY